jgi:hypothetical protein
MPFMLALCLSACGGEQRDAAPATPAVSPRAERPQEVGGGPAATMTPAPAPGATEVSPINSPPAILSLKLEPAPVFVGTSVKAVVEKADPQNDPVMLDFVWEKNGETLSGAVLDELDTTGMLRGDVLTVIVTPFDGKVKGESKRSRPVTLLNRPPEILSLPAPTIIEGVFTYAVKATDPDGDKLNFALEEAPPGMKIDVDSGQAEWLVPPGFDGKAQVKIVVSDGDAMVFQAFELNVSKKPM